MDHHEGLTVRILYHQRWQLQALLLISLHFSFCAFPFKVHVMFHVQWYISMWKDFKISISFSCDCFSF